MGRQAIPMQINPGDEIFCDTSRGSLRLVKPDGKERDLLEIIKLSGNDFPFFTITRSMDSGDFQLIACLIAVTHGLRAGEIHITPDLSWHCAFEHAATPAYSASR